MKKFTKKIAPFILVTALIITGIFAFLTSTDSKTNTFEVGNIDVELWEGFDTDDTEGTDGLDHDGDKFIYDNTDPTDEVYGPGENILYKHDIIPGQRIEKAPWQENTGSAAAYTYMVISSPILDENFADVDSARTKVTCVHCQYEFTAEEIEAGYPDGCPNPRGKYHPTDEFSPETDTYETTVYSGRPDKYEIFDFYHYERNADGSVVTDANGKPVLIEGFSDNWEVFDEVYSYSLDPAETDKVGLNNTIPEKYTFLAYTKELKPGEQTTSPFDVVKLKDEITQEYFELAEGGIFVDVLNGNIYNVTQTDLGGNVYTPDVPEYMEFNFPVFVYSYAIQSNIDGLDKTSEKPYLQAWDLLSEQEGVTEFMHIAP